MTEPAVLQPVRVGLVSVSDRASAGVYEDKGLPALREWLTAAVRNPLAFEERLIPDEAALISQTLRALVDEAGCDLVLTTGGTGPAPRDVTPEATLAVADREIPGFGEQMRQIGLRFVPTAILSRQVGVIRGRALVLNLPGQPKAIAETLEGLPGLVPPVPGIFAAVPYCLDLVGGPYIETRDELMQRSRELAQRLGFGGMSFLTLSVADSITSTALPPTVDIVTALHACDTATDDAIRFALRKKARYIVVVPCCQAEVAGVLRRNKGKSLGDALTEIWRHPLHTREFGSQITNVLRCLQLEAHGYQVSVTELVGWEHSMKNELIVAQYKDLPRRRPAQRLREILDTFGLAALNERFFVDDGGDGATAEAAVEAGGRE